MSAAVKEALHLLKNGAQVWPAIAVLEAALVEPQPAAPGTYSPCAGMNCGCTDGFSHSLECQAEHAAAIAGGRFVKAADAMEAAHA